jgi:YVTN family beta-propeller protein
MKTWMLAGALVAVVALTACERSSGATWQASQGSIALSTDDALIYAVDTDNELVAVVDAQTHKKVAEVKVGAAPEFITVGPDDTLYVANRGGRSVSVITRGDWTEARRLPVGVEPVALVVSEDNKVLYVVNGTSLESADYGTLTAIDLASGQPRWDLPVGEEPRGIALLDGGRTAIITLFKKGGTVKVDLTRPEVIRDDTALGTERKGLVYDSANRSARTGQAPAGTARFQPRSAGSVVAHPDGESAYTTVVWSREDPITTRPNSSGGYYASGGPCNLGAVATAGIVTYEGPQLTPKTDDLTGCGSQGFDEENEFPPSTLSGPSNDPSSGFGTPQPLQGPVALLVDPTGAWMFVLNRESQNLAVLPTRRRGGDDSSFNSTGTTVRDLVPVGQGANGLAMARDGTRAYVYNQFDHSITVIKSQQQGTTSRIVRAETIKVADDVLPPSVAMGRALFFNALDGRINNPVTTAVSCNTCHTEGGREDGHVWGFPDGRRQTPALAGRMMSQTAPFHWTGEFNDMKAFMDHTAVLRMGGQGLGAAERANVEAYMDFAAAPDNPHLRAQPTDAQLRGAQVFATAQCSTCHLGQARTDNRNYDVGTLRQSDHHPTLGRIEALNTPSLLGLARSAPYLHDGSAATLRDRITNNPRDAHGKTSDLTPAQVDDLVEYLKTL